MRILVLNQYFHPDRSATSQLLTELCEDLSQEDDVFVVTGRPSYNVAEDTSSSGLVSKEWLDRVHVARVWSTTFERSGMLRRLSNYGTYIAASVAGALSVRRPDVVVALTDPPPIGLVGLLIARLRRRPFVLVVKDIFPDVAIELGVLRNPLVISAMRAAQRVLFRGADRLVSIGTDMDRRLLDLGVTPDKIVTIHDWADSTVIRPLAEPSSFRRRQGWGSDRFVVMHSGNIGLSQDLECVIDAAAQLQDDPRFVFAFVGEGASKAQLQHLSSEGNITNVRFFPFQDKADLADSLGAADLHLITLKQGLAGFIVPSKLYGVLAAGKAYVAAMDEWGEPAVVAARHGCGVVVQPNQPRLLAETIRDLADRPDIAEMGAAGRQALLDRFDRRSASLAYQALLRSLAGTGQS